MSSSEVFTYKRVRAHPGKHGNDDYRLTIAGVAPTHGELVALLAGVLKAERRYPAMGPYMLWAIIDSMEPLFAKDWTAIGALAERVDDRSLD